MPDRMSNRMSEDMSDRMPEDLPVRKCINVMVGITRSKVILTAARTKSLLPGVVVASIRLHGSDASLQKVRSDGWTWARVLQELVSHNACTKAGPSKAQLASEADKGCGSDWDGFSLSSDTASSSSSLASDHDLSWFRLPRGVAHLVKDRSQALSLSLSLSLALFSVPDVF